LVRVQSPDGTKRVEVFNETLSQLYENVFNQFKIQPEQFSSWSLFTDRNRQNRIPNSAKTPAQKAISHGDMVYLLQATDNVTQAPTEVVCVEDEIDVALGKQDGLIYRNKDELL
jgi:hemolysin-activating ACP:hemolysin acyltransferase